MSDDRPAISSPQLSAADVARRTFATVRRGFDPEEVRLYLETVAEELVAAEQREEELQRELEAAEDQVLHPDIDEAMLTAALGQRSAAVLRKAHEEAGRITDQAEASAAAVLREAHQHANELQVQAEAAAAERIAEAELSANTLHQQSRQEAAEILETTRAESDAILERAREQGRAMIEQAQEARRRVLADMGHRRRVVAAQIDQYRAARDEVAAAVVGVRQSVDRIVEDLSRADDTARAAAAEVARRQPHEVTEDVLVAEAEAAAAELGARTGTAADLEATAPLSIDDIRTVVPHGPGAGGNPGGTPAIEALDGPTDDGGFAPSDPGTWSETGPGGGGQASERWEEPWEEPWEEAEEAAEEAAEEEAAAHADPSRELDDGARQDEDADAGAGGAQTALPEAPGGRGGDAGSGGSGWRPYVRRGEREIYDVEALEEGPAAATAARDVAAGDAEVSAEAEVTAGAGVAVGATPEGAGIEDGGAVTGDSGPVQDGERTGAGAAPAATPAAGSAPGAEDDGVEGLFARLRASQGARGRSAERHRGTSMRQAHDAVGEGSAGAGPEDGQGSAGVPASDASSADDAGLAHGAGAGILAAAGTEGGASGEAGEERRAASTNDTSTAAGRKSPGSGQQVPTDEAEEAEEADEEPTPAGTPEVEEALTRRAEVLDPVATVLARRLKRALQDDQNRLLERLRSGNGEWSDSLLPEEAEHRALYSDAAVPHLRDAVAAGISFARAVGRRRGKLPAPDEAAVQGMADELGGTVATLLRRRLTGDDVADAAERVGAAYREWRGERIERLVGDAAVEAFSAGVLAGVPRGTALRWVRNESSLGCADCEDNALGEAVPTGEEFPTGHLHPPAHAGCRCLVLPTPA